MIFGVKKLVFKERGGIHVAFGWLVPNMARAIACTSWFTGSYKHKLPVIIITFTAAVILLIVSTYDTYTNYVRRNSEQ